MRLFLYPTALALGQRGVVFRQHGRCSFPEFLIPATRETLGEGLFGALVN